MASILVLCNANQFRSPLAEYTLRRLLAKDPHYAGWQVSSAGVWATLGKPAVSGLAEWANLPGLASHRSRPLAATLVDQADLIIVMEKGQKEAVQLEFPQARERVLLLTELAGPVAYDIPDPAFSLEDPFKLIHEIIGLTEKGFAEIVSLAEAFAANRMN